MCIVYTERKKLLQLFLAKVLNGAQWAHELANKNEHSRKSKGGDIIWQNDLYVILHAIKVSE